MSQQAVTFTNSVAQALTGAIARIGATDVWFLADDNTAAIARTLMPAGARLIVTPAGDDHKTLEAASAIWTRLCTEGATRRSLLVNVGGGMVTDLGGFAAATFKRGIRFINVPTSLLGAVDAAVGGKTGVNFHGLKNEIGVFAEAVEVIVSSCFFATLPEAELLSGYAEMLKHALISSPEEFTRLAAIHPGECPPELMLDMLRRSVEVKRRIVADDPREQGIRKALNLGHTAGHAFESWAMSQGRPMPHGWAVAHGLLLSLVLSHTLCGMPSAPTYTMASLLRGSYAPHPAVECRHYPELLALMHHDKKNLHSGGRVNFTLLSEPGRPMIDCEVADSDITAALDVWRDLLGC